MNKHLPNTLRILYNVQYTMMYTPVVQVRALLYYSVGIYTYFLEDNNIIC